MKLKHEAGFQKSTPAAFKRTAQSGDRMEEAEQLLGPCSDYRKPELRGRASLSHYERIKR